MLLLGMVLIVVKEYMMAHRLIARLVYGAMAAVCAVEGLARLWRMM